MARLLRNLISLPYFKISFRAKALRPERENKLITLKLLESNSDQDFRFKMFYCDRETKFFNMLFKRARNNSSSKVLQLEDIVILGLSLANKKHHAGNLSGKIVTSISSFIRPHIYYFRLITLCSKPGGAT